MSLWSRFKNLIHAETQQDEIREELEFHLEMDRRNGHKTREARLRLGNISRIQEDVYRVNTPSFVDNALRDAKHAIRSFRRNPGFTLVTILTLALGIGAATAVFSVVDAVLLQPLPYKQPNRLVAVWGHSKQDPNLPKVFLNYSDFDEFRRNATTVEDVAAAAWGPMAGHILSGTGPARQLTVIPVSSSFFRLLGAEAELGRTFVADDEKSGCAIVLANSLWTIAFGADRTLAGRSITLDQKPCSVVGIMPARFAFFPSQAQGWLLIPPNQPADTGVGVFARLKQGSTIAAAQTEMSRLYAATGRWAPRFEPQVFDLHGEFTFLASRTLRTTLLVSLSAVGLLLFIACMNVGNLMLARISERQREMALRAALGSGQGRLIAQVLTESLLLSFLGTLVGIGFAFGAIRYFQQTNPVELTVGANIELQARVLGFAALLMLATALGFGFWPALSATKANLVDRLKTGGRGTVGGGLSRASIAIQMGMSFVLLATAILLMQSSLNMGAEKLGFEVENRAATRFSLPRSRYPENSQRAAFYERLERETANIQSIQASALASRVPPDAGGFQQTIEIEGQNVALDSAPINIGTDAVSSGFFDLLSIPLRQGRLFDPHDRPNSEAVAIVNEELASQYFRDTNPVGQRVRLISGSEPSSPWLTIVGVVGNVKQTMLLNEMRWTVAPHLYRPAQQDPQVSMNLVVHFGSSPAPIAEALRRVTASLDPEVPLDDFQPVQAQIAKILAYSRFRTVIVGFFAISALTLSAIGLHGVLRQLLKKRVAEFGVRRAIGARDADILNMVLRQSGWPVLGGLLLGFALTSGLSRLIASLLYGSAAIHPTILAMVALALIVTSALAILRPALAALRVDPMEALRGD